MFRTSSHQCCQLLVEFRECLAQAERQTIFGPLPTSAARQWATLCPGTYNALLMAGFGTKRLQVLPDVLDLSHGRMLASAALGRKPCCFSDLRVKIVIDKGFRFAIQSAAFRYQAYKDGVPDEDIFRQTA